MKERKLNKESIETLVNVTRVSMGQIVANRYQPRTTFNEAELRDLADSIRQHGILQPLVLRQVTSDMYEIIAGERRFRAAKLAGLTEVDTIIKDVSATEAAILALVENIQRSDLSAIEEAKSYEKLMTLYSKTQSEIALMVGVSQSALANKLRLLQLDSEIQQGIEKKIISERHGRALLKIKSKKVQVKIYYWIVKNKLTVAETEKYIERYLQNENGKTDSNATFFNVAKDTKLAVNTINKAVKTIRDFGMDVQYTNEETDDQYILKVLIPKKLVEKTQKPVILPHEKLKVDKQIFEAETKIEDTQSMLRQTFSQQDGLANDTTTPIVLDLDLTSETVFLKPEEVEQNKK